MSELTPQTRKKGNKQLPDKQADALASHGLLQFVKLVDIHTVQLSAIRHPSLDQLSEPPNIKIASSNSLDVAYDQESRAVIAMVGLAIEGKDESESLFSISAMYRAIYSISDKFQGDQIEERSKAFCRLNSLAHVWPYWRELLATTSTKMGMTPIIAPLVIVGAHMKTSKK